MIEAKEAEAVMAPFWVVMTLNKLNYHSNAGNIQKPNSIPP
jgi:hypothetical protein